MKSCWSTICISLDKMRNCEIQGREEQAHFFTRQQCDDEGELDAIALDALQSLLAQHCPSALCMC